jgi:hypothetical protein
MVVKLGWLDYVCHYFHHQGTSMFVVQIVFFKFILWNNCENIWEHKTNKKRMMRKINTNASMTKKQYSMHKPHL